MVVASEGAPVEDVRAAVFTGFGFGGAGTVEAITGAFGGRWALVAAEPPVLGGTACVWIAGARATIGGDGGAIDEVLDLLGIGGADLAIIRGLSGIAAGLASGGVGTVYRGACTRGDTGLATGRGAALGEGGESDLVALLSPRNGNLFRVVPAYGSRPGLSNSGRVETCGR